MGTQADAADASNVEVEEPQFVEPADIDEAYAPKLFDGLVTVEVDGEQIVMGGLWGQAQILNPTAALIWQFFDGDSTLGELIDDFSDATDTPRDVVAKDVLEFAKSLGYGGYFSDVMESFEEIDLDQPMVELDPGTELDAFTATDLDGTDRAITDFRGRGVYLVNWNPGCGFCDMIAGTLAQLEGPLADAGYDLVLVAGGDADSNRKLVERVDLHAPVLLPNDGARPFGMMGTPAAIALDERGLVSHELASGAFDVPKQAAELAGVELPEPETADAGASYLPAGGGMCGAGASTSGPKTTWQGTRAFEFGDVRVGVRFNNDWTAAMLDRLLAGARVDDAEVPANYSVALTDPAHPSKELELLLEGASLLVRSRSRKRVLVGLLNHLAAHLSEPDPALQRINASAAIDRDGRALLLPGALTDMIGKLQPRLAKLGLTLLDAPYVQVDPATSELVVPDPAIEFDAAVLDEVEAGVRLGRTELPVVEAGRYPLESWYVYAFDPEDDSWRTDGTDSLRPALAVASTIGQCVSSDAEATATTLATLVRQVPVRPVHYASATELTDALRTR